MIVTGYSSTSGSKLTSMTSDRIDPARAARHHVLFINRGKLVADDLLDFILARQDILELGNLAFELLDVLGAVEDVLLVDVAELDFGNKLRLGLVDIKAAASGWARPQPRAWFRG